MKECTKKQATKEGNEERTEQKKRDEGKSKAAGKNEKKTKSLL